MTFPEDAEQPEVQIASRSREVLDLVIYGDVSTQVLHELAELARDQLLQNPNINPVDRNDGRWVEKISEEALHQLRHNEYPDNFRGLERILWQAVLYAREEGVDVLMAQHLGPPRP